MKGNIIMCENNNYGIIREHGEFMDPVPLSDKDNEIVNESLKRDSKDIEH